MLWMIILPSSSRSSSLRRLGKQEIRGVQELLRTNIHTIFWQWFNMWNIINQYLDFFHCHWPQAHTHSVSEVVCSQLQVKTCDLLIYLCLFFSPQKTSPNILYLKNSHNILSFANSSKFFWHSKYTPFTQVYHHCIFVSPYFLAYQKLTPLNAQGKHCTTSPSSPEDESRLLLE